MSGSIYYVFFDTETTGVPLNYKAPSSNTANWPRLVQLSWIAETIDGEIVSKGNYIIKPNGFIIPSEAAAIHGITTARANREGIPLEEALEHFMADAKEARVLVGHNVSFDIKVLGCEYYRTTGRDPLMYMKSIDTMLSSVDYCAIPGRFGYKWPKLQELHCTLFGEEFEDAHDSSADIAATEKCFWKLKDIGVI